jgi:uncharacterized protein (TIGR00369 family)
MENSIEAKYKSDVLTSRIGFQLVTNSFDPAAAGWQKVKAGAFLETIGPIWRRLDNGRMQCGLVVTGEHTNTAGFAHGGVLTTLLDSALGLASAEAQGGHQQATIGLNVQFLAPVRVGDFITVECEVVKATRTLMFMQGTLRADDNICATAQGTWKILRR